MASPSAHQIAKGVLDREKRYLHQSQGIGIHAILQAWETLIAAPRVVAEQLSVREMCRLIVSAATAIQSVYEICAGEMPLDPIVIGQRAIGQFSFLLHGKHEVVLKWCHITDSPGGAGQDIEWGWTASVHPPSDEQGEVVTFRAKNIDLLCEMVYSSGGLTRVV